ncbi:MAG: tail fiber domain-containing protein [Woeseiaceae bacterium]
MMRKETIVRRIRHTSMAGLLLAVFGINSAAAQGVLFVENGEVGIGVADPVARFHVFNNDGSAQIRVEETNAAVSARSMFELYNNGPVGFNMYNTSTSETWRFAAQNTGFRVSLGGSGGPEFEVTETGGMTVGPGASTVFDLQPSGNLTISGVLTQSSDVNTKRDIDAVDAAQVLARLAQLPISEWTYKSDNDGARHLGPMAQDFHQIFQLGDDNTKIAPGDMAGVSLAAIKALQLELVALRKEKDAEIAALKAAKDAELAALNGTLNERLSALEAEMRSQRRDGSVGYVE